MSTTHATHAPPHSNAHQYKEPAWHRRQRQQRSTARIATKLLNHCLLLHQHHGSQLPPFLQALIFQIHCNPAATHTFTDNTDHAKRNSQSHTTTTNTHAATQTDDDVSEAPLEPENDITKTTTPPTTCPPTAGHQRFQTQTQTPPP